MDREQIRRRWEALKSAWAALKGPEAFLGEHFAHEDDVQAALEAVAADPSAPILLPWQRNLLGLKPVAEPAAPAQPSLL